MKKLYPIHLLILTLAILSACGGKKEESEEEKSTLGALKEFSEKAEEMSKKEAVEPVSFQELKELLPSELAGIPRTEAQGESNGSMGFKISVAKAKYEKDDKNLDVDIMDLGGVGGFAVAGLAAWTLAESEKETDNGYERTIKLDGHKGFEQYNNADKSGELKLFINERFLVSLEGRNLSMDEIKSAFRQMDFSKLPKE